MKIVKHTYKTVYTYQQDQSNMSQALFKTKDCFNKSILQYSYYTVI